MWPLGLLVLSAALCDFITNISSETGVIIVMSISLLSTLLGVLVGVVPFLIIFATAGILIFLAIEFGLIYETLKAVKKFQEIKEYEAERIMEKLKHGSR